MHVPLTNHFTSLDIICMHVGINCYSTYTSVVQEIYYYDIRSCDSIDDYNYYYNVVSHCTSVVIC